MLAGNKDKSKKGVDIMAGLNTVFKQVFGEGLKDQGFVKIKGRQPYLVRVIGGEIIHIITCRNEWCGDKGFKEFSILGSVATVYRDSIMDLTRSPHANINDLDTLYEIYRDRDPLKFDREYGDSIYSFIYKAGDDISMSKAMEHALEEAKKVMMPFFDGVADLESCLDYFERFKGGMVIPPSGEGLLYIKTNNHDDLIEKTKEKIDTRIRAWEKNNIQFSPDIIRRDTEEWRDKVVERKDEIFGDLQIYEKTLKELEQRKCANIEILRSYGLDI